MTDPSKPPIVDEVLALRLACNNKDEAIAMLNRRIADLQNNAALEQVLKDRRALHAKFEQKYGVRLSEWIYDTCGNFTPLSKR